MHSCPCSQQQVEEVSNRLLPGLCQRKGILNQPCHVSTRQRHVSAAASWRGGPGRKVGVEMRGGRVRIEKNSRGRLGAQAGCKLPSGSQAHPNAPFHHTRPPCGPRQRSPGAVAEAVPHAIVAVLPRIDLDPAAVTAPAAGDRDWGTASRQVGGRIARAHACALDQQENSGTGGMLKPPSRLGSGSSSHAASALTM